jgi:iron complex transport system substrate-binding protein
VIRVAATAVAVALLGASGCAATSRAAGPACTPVTLSVDDRVDALPAPVPRLPVTVRSADGRDVTVRDASRILAVNLYGSLAEIVYGLGLGARLVGRDRSTTFAGARNLPLVTGTGHDLAAEAVLRLDPTVVITDGSIGPNAVLAQLRAAGVPVVLVDDEQSVAGVATHVRAVAAALGVRDAGEHLAARIGRDLLAARPGAATTKPVVAFLYLRGSAGVYLLGGDGAGSDDLIEAAGGIDAGTRAHLQRFRPITSEALAAARPDVILVMTGSLASVGGVDGLLAMPGIAQTPAAAHRRVIAVDDGLLLSFGTRTPRVVSALANALREPCP